MDKRSFMDQVSTSDYADSQPLVKPEGQLFPEVFMAAVAGNTQKRAEQPAEPRVNNFGPHGLTSPQSGTHSAGL
jgi:hypothetical protein